MMLSHEMSIVVVRAVLVRRAVYDSGVFSSSYLSSFHNHPMFMQIRERPDEPLYLQVFMH